MTPDTGPFDVQVASSGIAAVVDKAGPSVLFTHSQGGGVGWYTTLKSEQVKAIVSFEPGSSFVFPEGELPQPIKNNPVNQSTQYSRCLRTGVFSI